MTPKPYPILGIALNTSNSLAIDLSQNHLQDLCMSPQDREQLSQYIYTGLIRFGGYLEHRSLYAMHELFDEDSGRNIHLGLDFWAREGAVVHLPWAGKIISVQDNAGEGDYGPTLIIQHKLQDKIIYSLYGHLSRNSLYHQIGDVLEQGTPIASIGGPEENGGWPPHLHFQLIRDLEGKTGDYPGVCSIETLQHYQHNCPDPADYGLIPIQISN